MNRTIVIFLVIVLLAVGFSFLVPSIRNVFIQTLSTVGGKLMIQGTPPQIVTIYVNISPALIADQPLNDPGVSTSQQLTPPGPSLAVPNGYLYVLLNVTVYDVNSDCDGGGATFYICSNTTGLSTSPYCNENYDTDLRLNTSPAVRSGSNCSYVSSFYLPYWKKWGNWYVNATVKDTTLLPGSAVKYFYDGRTFGINYVYPYGAGTIDLGSISLGGWNDDRGRNTSRNAGNVRVNLTWSATNFAGGTPPDTIVIDDYNFLLSNGTTTRIIGTYGNVSGTSKSFPRPLGLEYRCFSDACTNDIESDNTDNAGADPSNYANLTYNWFINVPLGKSSGTYTNTITITPCPCEGAGACSCTG